MVSVEKAQQEIFFLEGNIGAGKSTFLSILEKNFDFEIVFEPTDKWQRVNNNDGNLLDLFYKDSKRWAYTFQSFAFISRVRTQFEQNQKMSKKIQILERSVYCDRFCFAKNCFEIGLMGELEWHIYKEWFDWMVEEYLPTPQGFIYLRVSPETCLERLKKRNRSEESAISLDYLQSLHDKHENWLIHKKELLNSIQNLPILVLDCNAEFEKDKKQQEHIFELVDSFIKNVTKRDYLTKKQNSLHTGNSNHS